MAPMDARAAEALRFFQRMARTGAVRVTRKAQQEFQIAYRGHAEFSVVWDALGAATASDVRKVVPDHADASRTVIVLRLPFQGSTAYVKASLKLDLNASAFLLSCKRWER